MQRPRIRLALLVTVVLAALAGCTALGGQDDATDRGRDIADRAAVAAADAETYRFVMNATVNTDQGSVDMDAAGVVDRAARRLRMTMDMAVESGDRSRTVGFDGYAVNDTMYVEHAGRWQTQDLPATHWNNTRIDRQRKLLENSTVTLVGNETVRGIETYVISVDPPEERVKEIAAQQPGQASMEGVDIENITYTQYVAKESMRIRKVEMTMAFSANGRSADMEMTMLFLDYGRPVTVELPADAPNGTETADGMAPPRVSSPA